MAMIAVATTRARPRLSASDMGIEVRGIGGAHYYTWPQVTDVRLVHTRRLAREVPSIEIDVQVGQEDRLLIFTKLDLVADPEDVADALTQLRESGTSAH
ncbi:PH domain-containing protein [Pseudonocardia spinosispora]|uniref:PH domain-containing protein n=1 Tax=Pseudonocardia spinosispora TaxID=103441 RepID=UPI000400F7D9|nr:PH domain-containing protein [Pseudonocardia spinosispora]